MHKKENKEARLNIRIEQSLKEELQEAAKKDNRSLANFVTNILKAKLEEMEQRQLQPPQSS